MPIPVLTPRLNNNDDTVRLARMLVSVGEAVRAGDAIAEVVTDKATVVVDTACAGYVIHIRAREDDVIDVGSVLVWIGEHADDVVPTEPVAGGPGVAGDAPVAQEPVDLPPVTQAPRLTLKARMLARQAAGPDVAGTRVPLRPEERAMLRTVTWSQGAAVPSYLELGYDPEPWGHYARTFQDTYGLLFDPLLSLMAWELVQIVKERRHLNATIVDQHKHVYAPMNLGFAVHGPSALYLVVVHGADRLSDRELCERLTTLQRRAMSETLEPRDVSGATVAFTSMARWNVTRHIPVLPPFTSLIVAHSAPQNGDARLGATYDHRLLGGGEVAAVLDALGRAAECRLQCTAHGGLDQ